MPIRKIPQQLSAVCKQIAKGDYEKARTVFELMPGESPNTGTALLREALSVMLQGVEARDRELAGLTDEVSEARENLKQLHSRLSAENKRLRAQMRKLKKLEAPAGQSQAMRKLVDQAQKLAQKDQNLLITGEPGSDKVQLGRYIHQLGARAAKPFIVVNISAIPAPLLESELFGVDGDQDTQSRVGRFEKAQGGTIFLYNIHEAPREIQARVLQVMEGRGMERVGSPKPVPLDVRVMAASIRPGLAQPDGHEILEPLWNAFAGRNELTIPPLRERLEDLPVLIKQILGQYAEEVPLCAQHVSPRAFTLLMQHSWPDNVRELRRELEQAALLASGPAIQPEDLSPALRKVKEGKFRNMSKDPRGQKTISQVRSLFEQILHADTASCPSLREMEVAYINKVLTISAGNKSKAARILDISREGLRIKVERKPDSKPGRAS